MHGHGGTDGVLLSPAKGHVDRRVAAVAAQGPLAEGDSCVTDLLARERVPVSSIYGNVTELLLAGVDTVRGVTLGCPCCHRGSH